MKRLIAVVAAAAVGAVGIGCGGGRTPDISPHLISAPESAPVRPIDGMPEKSLSPLTGELDEGGYRDRVNELYAVVVYDRCKPVLDESDPVRPVYEAARAVGDRYMLNAWQTSENGEYETVHAVHDYLAYYVNYDFELYERFENGETDLEQNPAFHIDGVFLNGRAVCDGISRAFDFLCAIEGVRSVRITGSMSSSPHAWNKVNIGGLWYNIDVTSDAAYYTSGKSYARQLSHGFFLLSDDTFKSFEPNSHVSASEPYSARVDFDYYADKTIDVGGKKFSAVVKNQAELNALFLAADKSKNVGKIEVKLDFPNKIQVNVADMYASEIAEAYGKLSHSDYSLSDGLPYFRYPNGVYLFLIRK